MIKIEVYNVFSRLVGDIPEDLTLILDNQLSYFEESYIWNWKYQRGWWDGKIHLYNKTHRHFKLGLLYRVISIFKAEGVEYAIEDKRNGVPTLNLEYLENPLLPLRDVQKESILAFTSKFYGTNLCRGIIEKPPRTGKTRTAASLAKVLNAFPMFFVAHRIDLILQAMEDFAPIFPETEIGLIGDGVYNPQPLINLTTIQSITNAFEIKDTFDEKEKDIGHHSELRELLLKAQTCIIDEVHVSGSNTFQRLPDLLENVIYIAGLTGTASRDDGADLAVEQLCGPKIYSLSRSKAVEKGYILPVIVYFVMLPEMGVSSYDWQTQKKEGLIHSPYVKEASKRIVNRLRSKNMSSVIIVREKIQGENIKKEIGCELLYSKFSGRDRKEIYNKIQTKEINEIVSTVTDIGVNIPSLDAVIIAQPSKSKVAAFQRIRSNTPFNNKKVGRVFVLCPRIKIPPELEKKGKNYLKNHWNFMLNLYKKEKSFEVKILEMEQI